jgi:magnesium transporter
VGSVNDANVREYLLEEMKMAFTMASVLGVAGCIRAAAFFVPVRETIAITTSLWLIVFFSIVLGSLLPLAMKHVHIDPAHSSTTIQVLMDILGVVSALLRHRGGSWLLLQMTHILPVSASHSLDHE